ncbi:MAG: MGMT family protein [Deltaproteobacteria bacterium]|jgi:methylated-DNA-protein-cysteine methyltransferase-like protein|nr:MGMT family protein [Deltaproteobacteria bacterium]
MKFFDRVFAVVATIPPGKVMTYGQISQVLDNACSARYVGYAMGAAPEGLPCHRVVNRLGEMAPHLFNGRQREILEAEGAPFKPDGRLNLEECLYWPEGRLDFEDAWPEEWLKYMAPDSGSEAGGK